MNVGVFHSAIVTNKEQTGELEDWAEKARATGTPACDGRTYIFKIMPGK